MSEKVICAQCGKEIDKDDAYLDPDGQFMCEDCYDEYVVTCEDCHCDVWSDDTTVVHHANGESALVCDDCRSDYHQCDDCEEWYEDVTWRDDECYCENCIGNHPIELVDRFNPITCYHEHHDIEPIFFNLDNEENMPYFGVELEVDDRHNTRNRDFDDIALDVCDSMPDSFIYFETDGSLDSGFENITQPATLAYHMSIKDKYKSMFKILVRSGMRSHQTGTCGLHVHFNRSFFTPDEEETCVARLLYLVENFWDDMVVFSRRNSCELDRWCKRYDKDVESVAKDWKEGCCYEDRYHAVNLCNRNTIEFRMFRGTLKLNTFIATLQMCQNLVMTAKHKATAEIQRMSFDELITTLELEQYWYEARKRKGLIPDEENTNEEENVNTEETVNEIG